MPDSSPINIRVLLADDHPIVMAGCKTCLSDFAIDVIGQASSPVEVLDLFLELRPDVVVLDVKFGQAQTGFDAAKSILKATPSAKIVFWSQCDQDSVIKEGYRIGCYAYMTKETNSSDLAIAIRHAHEGKLYFHPLIAERLANLTVRGDNSPQSVLDGREMVIFKLMAKGLTNQEIADSVQLTIRTIVTITSAIKEKVGARRGADITILAVRHQLIEM